MTRDRNISSKSNAIAAPLSRRQALAFGLGGLVAAGGLLAFGPRAFALTLVEADAPVASAFHGACGTVQYHDALVDEVRQLLRNRDDGAEAIPENIDCPVCGCRLAVTQMAPSAR